VHKLTHLVAPDGGTILRFFPRGCPGEVCACGDPRRSRLLGAPYVADLFGLGWVPVYEGQDPAEVAASLREAARRKDPEGVREVVKPTTLTSDKVHGGQSAGGDVPGSPNSGRRRTRPRRRRRGRSAWGRRGGRQGGQGGRVPQEVAILSTEERRAARQVADIFAQLVGQYQRAEDVPGLDVFDLVWRDEVGVDITPALDKDLEQDVDAVRILISPDESRSCATFSGFTVAVAWEIRKSAGGDADVHVIRNHNGRIDAGDLTTPANDYDIVWYIGDGDASFLIEAFCGRLLIYFDTYAHNYDNVRVNRPRPNVIVVTHVDVGDAGDILEAWKRIKKLLTG